MRKHVESDSIKPCVLTQDDLIELSDVVRDGFPEEHGFSVTAEFNNVNIDMGSIEEFLTYKKLPDVLENLIMRAWYPKKYFNVREIEKDIHVTFDNLYSILSTDGDDETWAIGKHKQVLRILNERTDKFHSIKDIPRRDFFISIIIGLWITLIIGFVPTLDFLYITIFSISSTYLIMKYVNWARWSLPRGTRIIIRSNKATLWGMNVKDLIPIVVSILGLILSASQIFR